MEILPTLFRFERDITLEQHYQGTTGGRMQLHAHADKTFGRVQLPHIDSGSYFRPSTNTMLGITEVSTGVYLPRLCWSPRELFKWALSWFLNAFTIGAISTLVGRQFYTLTSLCLSMNLHRFNMTPDLVLHIDVTFYPLLSPQSWQFYYYYKEKISLCMRVRSSLALLVKPKGTLIHWFIDRKETSQEFRCVVRLDTRPVVNYW